MKLVYTFNKSTHPQGSKITIPFGIKKMKIKTDVGSATILEIGGISGQQFNVCTPIEFPIINGKSPNTFTLSYLGSNTTNVEILLQELGGIPDPNYFSDTPTVIPEIISDEPTEQEEKKDAI